MSNTERFDLLRRLANSSAPEPALALHRTICAGRGTPADRRALAAAAQRAGKEKEAIAAYEACLADFADDPFVLTNLAELYLSAQRFSAAAPLLERAILLDPQAAHPGGVRARGLVAITNKKLGGMR